MQINKTIALSLLAAWATQPTMAAKKQRATERDYDCG